jgi:hypothetical protein
MVSYNLSPLYARNTAAKTMPAVTGMAIAQKKACVLSVLRMSDVFIPKKLVTNELG